jgi:hypothetical protein
MNYEPLLAVLPDSKEDAKSRKEIALAMGLDISSHASWIREQRTLARVLRILVKWGWAACDRRQRNEGLKFWCNVYWKTEIASQSENSKLFSV